VLLALLQDLPAMQKDVLEVLWDFLEEIRVRRMSKWLPSKIPFGR
jgi:hypothetical protein